VDIILKVVIVIAFLATAYVTLLWHGGAERGLTLTQRRAAALTAIFGWMFTFVLASLA
jgi:hypothetical protein